MQSNGTWISMHAPGYIYYYSIFSSQQYLMAKSKGFFLFHISMFDIFFEKLEFFNSITWLVSLWFQLNFLSIYFSCHNFDVFLTCNVNWSAQNANMACLINLCNPWPLCRWKVQRSSMLAKWGRGGWYRSKWSWCCKCSS